jgi:hypothetical protein
MVLGISHIIGLFNGSISLIVLLISAFVIITLCAFADHCTTLWLLVVGLFRSAFVFTNI